MSRGGTRQGAGRKRGAPNKASAKRQAEVKATGLTPLDYMLSVLRDDSQTLDVRLDAANKAAPYVHPKLSSVEHGGAGGGPILIARVERTIVDPSNPADRDA